MGIPFGISVGDFVAVIKLLNDVTRAVSQTRGSEARLKSVIQILTSLTDAINNARVAYTDWTSSSPLEKRKAAPAMNGIIMETQLCAKIITDFLDRSRSYTDSLINGKVDGKGSKMKREWKKISWFLFREEDALQLGRDLQGHLLALVLYSSAQMKYYSSNFFFGSTYR
jgi:hypothetical protein